MQVNCSTAAKTYGMVEESAAAQRKSSMAKRILIVEDEEDHRDLLRLIFSVHGFDVDTAATALDALAIVHQRRPDVMVVDVMLPDLSGWELSDRIKQELAPDTRILILSASADIMQRFQHSRADDVMMKPFDDDELLAKVRHLLA